MQYTFQKQEYQKVKISDYSLQIPDQPIFWQDRFTHCVYALIPQYYNSEIKRLTVIAITNSSIERQTIWVSEIEQEFLKMNEKNSFNHIQYALNYLDKSCGIGFVDKHVFDLKLQSEFEKLKNSFFDKMTQSQLSKTDKS